MRRATDGPGEGAEEVRGDDGSGCGRDAGSAGEAGVRGRPGREQRARRDRLVSPRKPRPRQREGTPGTNGDPSGRRPGGPRGLPERAERDSRGYRCATEVAGLYAATVSLVTCSVVLRARDT